MFNEEGIIGAWSHLDFFVYLDNKYMDKLITWNLANFVWEEVSGFVFWETF